MNILHSPCFLYTVYNVIVEFSSKTIVTNSRRGHALDTFPPPQPVHKLLFKKRRKKKNFSKLKTDNSPSGNISTRVFPLPATPSPRGEYINRACKRGACRAAVKRAACVFFRRFEPFPRGRSPSPSPPPSSSSSPPFTIGEKEPRRSGARFRPLLGTVFDQLDGVTTVSSPPPPSFY